MKKGLKIVLIIIGIFVLCLVVDVVSIYARKKPIFAVTNADKTVYEGLLYNTYTCDDSKPQIKAKWNKYSCPNFKIKTTETDGNGWYNG